MQQKMLAVFKRNGNLERRGDVRSLKEREEKKSGGRQKYVHVYTKVCIYAFSRSLYIRCVQLYAYLTYVCMCIYCKTVIYLYVKKNEPNEFEISMNVLNLK